MSRAVLVLEDGTSFQGSGFGAPGETFGEVVFNTGMSGYQEVLTDPSYARQIVVMTYPHQGNYGVNAADPESARVQVAGLVVREAARRPSSWRAEASLTQFLERAGVVGVEGIDTRALTLHIREAGAMRAAISTRDLDVRSLAARVREQPGMLGADLAAAVSTDRPYEAREIVGVPALGAGRTFRVAAFDWGLKRGSLRLLARKGCETVVYPALTPADEVLAEGYDGVFLSNGPGDPAATDYAVRTTRSLVGKVPLFGICLGHQVLGRAIGGSTYKLKFGHRGVNQPVIDLESGRVEVTSHNHGFAVDPNGWAGGPAAPSGISTTTGGPAAPVRGHHPPPGPRVPAPPSQPWLGLRSKGWDDERSTRGPGSGWGARGMRVGPSERVGAGAAVPRVVNTSFGRAALTHWNLNDGTLEGMRLLDAPAFSVQYHPEAAPGPHDSAYLFERFIELMGHA